MSRKRVISKTIQRLTRLLVNGAAFSCFLSLAPSSSAQSEDNLLLENLRVIVGDGNVLPQASILIRGSTIISVSASLPANLPADVVRIDLSGKTVLPALIDGHAHLGYEKAGRWGAEHYTRSNLIENLQRYAYYGFGAVFSAGSDPDEFALALQAELQAEAPTAARLLFAAGMAPPGQGPNDQFLSQALAVADKTGMTILRGLSSPENARAAVREVAAKGISFIKLWVDDRGGSQVKLEPDIYRAAIDEAQKYEIKVFVHQQYATDMPDLLSAGVAGFLHGRFGPDLGATIAKQIDTANAFVVPNLGLGELRREFIGADPFLQETLTGSVIERLSGVNGSRQLNPLRNRVPGTDGDASLTLSLKHLLDANVDIVLGTDAGAIPDHFFGYTGHRELEIFVRLGMSPMQAIMAATSVAAAHLGLDDMGLLAPGYSADLLILNEDPLINIRNTRSINRVYLRGRSVNRGFLRDSFQELAN